MSTAENLCILLLLLLLKVVISRLKEMRGMGPRDRKQTRAQKPVKTTYADITKKGTHSAIIGSSYRNIPLLDPHQHGYKLKFDTLPRKEEITTHTSSLEISPVHQMSSGCRSKSGEPIASLL
jgi:hypothetical protein